MSLKELEVRNREVGVEFRSSAYAIDSKVSNLFLRLRREFGEKQLLLFRTCLSSITFLLRMAELGGISAQQVLRKRYRVLVRHINIGDEYFAELVKSGQVVCRVPDDCLATNSLLLTRKAFALLYQGPIKYKMSPAYSYLPGKDVSGAVELWDRSEFERTLLPVLEREGNLEQQISVYKQAVQMQDPESDTYVLYDVLVRLVIYAREHNMVATRKGIEGLCVIDHIKGLTDHQAECIDVSDANGFLEALKLIHPTAVIQVHEGKTYLVKDKPVNTLGCVFGKMTDLPADGLLHKMVEGLTEPLAVNELPHAGVVDRVEKETYINLVARILGQSGNPTTPEEVELIEYSRKLIAAKRVGKTTLAGLGSVAGTGELGMCVDRTFREVRKRCAGKLSDGECLKLAASKLCQMNSAKTCTMIDGKVHLSNRTAVIMPPPSQCAMPSV